MISHSEARAGDNIGGSALLTESARPHHPLTDAETDDGWAWTSRVSPGAFVAIMTIVAAVLRLLYLGKQSLWHDEAFSVALTQSSWRDMLLTIPHNEAMSPYQVVLRLWKVCFGDSEAALRMPSVIFSVATLAPLYALARRLTGPRVAAVTAILFAVNGFSIRYAQETRCYSLMLLLVVCSWVFFLRCLDAPELPNYTGYVATSALGAYTHIFNTLSYPAQWLPIMRSLARIKLRLALIASGVLSCVLILPKGLSVLSTDVGQASYIDPTSGIGVFVLFVEFSGSVVPGHGDLLLLTAVYLTASVYGALALIIGSRESERAGDRGWFIVLGFAIPIGAVLIVSIVKALLVSRYLIEGLPFFMILCAVGLCRARPRWIGAVGLGVIVVLSLHQDHLYSRREGNDWRRATAYVLTNAKPRDGVLLVVPGSRWPYDYYVSKSGAADPPPVIFPAWDSQFRVERIDWARYYVEPKIFEPLVLRVIDDAPKRYTRIWLVMWPTDAPDQPDQASTPAQRLWRATRERLGAALGKRYRLNSTKDFSTDIRVRLYDRAADTPP